MAYQQLVTPAILQSLAVSYQPSNLIADKLITSINVRYPAGLYRIRGKETLMATADDRIGEVGVPGEIATNYATAPWICQNHALKEILSAEAIDVADASINLEADAVMQLKTMRALNKENDVAVLLTNSANYASGFSTALSGTSQWSDYINSDPIVQIEALRKLIFRGGNTRLVAWCGYDVWSQLKNHPKVLARISGGAVPNAPAFLLKQLFAELIEVDDFVVGEVRTGAYTGAPLAAYNRMWGKNFGIVEVEQTTSVDFLGFAARFVYQEPKIFQWQDIEPGLAGAKVIKISESYDQRVVANDTGVLFNTAVA